MLATGLYVLPALISFFFNDIFETNYLRIYQTDFHEILPNFRYFIVDY